MREREREIASGRMNEWMNQIYVYICVGVRLHVAKCVYVNWERDSGIEKVDCKGNSAAANRIAIIGAFQVRVLSESIGFENCTHKNLNEEKETRLQAGSCYSAINFTRRKGVKVKLHLCIFLRGKEKDAAKKGGASE